MAEDFKLILITSKTSQEVFDAVLKVRQWWSGYHDEKFTGDTTNLNDEFSFSAGGGMHYSKQKIAEIVPNEKIVWLVTEGNLGFVEKRDEWVGTKIIFEISNKGDKRQLVFTHEGLTPEIECYESCAPAWTTYLQNKLLSLINNGDLS